MTEESSNSTPAPSPPRLSWLAIWGPGLLVAATGVGAGDLATSALTGGKLGTAVLWAVVLGAFLKFVLNEGLTRWQLATDDTLLEGCVKHFGRPFQWVFGVYLIAWSFLVGLALMSACGVTMHAILPVGEATNDKIGYGIAHSLAAVLLVRWGGYRLFEKLMTVCIGVMFCVVAVTAVAIGPSWSEVVGGLLIPRIPAGPPGESGLSWTVALMGGVGGTLTILCYGYWIREEGRTDVGSLRLCRGDLAAGYLMTAVFGVAMVVIGSHTGPFAKGGSSLLVELATTLETSLGSVAKWAFLAGAWGAVFSSLLGVWQSVPYLFADFWNLSRVPRGTDLSPDRAVDTDALPYRGFLYGLAVVPAVGLFTVPFASAQKVYAVVGALVLPLLSVVLLLLNGSGRYLPPESRNSRVTNLLLVAILVFFLWAGWLEIATKLF